MWRQLKQHHQVVLRILIWPLRLLGQVILLFIIVGAFVILIIPMLLFLRDKDEIQIPPSKLSRL